jgi:opacity protein-like surface antigen
MMAPSNFKLLSIKELFHMDIRNGFLALAMLAASATAVAQDRAGTWDVGFTGLDTSSDSISGSGGSGLSVEGDLGWGFTTNYNITNRLALGGDFTWLSPDYQAKQVIDGTNTVVTVDAELDVATLHFKGTFYLTEGAVAPYIEAGGGWTRIDSNIADGPPTTGCWWDPWWGYICTSFYDTYAETRTSYTYGVGLRWDVSDDFVVRGSYGILDVDTANSEDVNMDVIRVDFGWKF